MSGTPIPDYYSKALTEIVDFNSPQHPDFDLIFKAKKIGDFGKRLKLSCGTNWIIGKDFIASVYFWADSYYRGELQIFEEFKNPKIFNELKVHILKYDFTIHCPEIGKKNFLNFESKQS